MRERPIFFNGDMVRAVLNGSKTQTRRIMKVQPHAGVRNSPFVKSGIEDGHGKELVCPFGAVGDRLWVRETFATLGNEDGVAIDWDDNLVKGGGREAAHIYRASCEQRPGNYGLWSIPDDAFWKPHTDNMQYEGAWVPSIHMPRWASRITLEITSVRVERLKHVPRDRIIAEGYPAERAADGGYYDPFLWYRDLWESIYGEGSWQANPWVWVVEFKRVEGE